MSGERLSRLQWIEFGLLFSLLVPFYLLWLPREGPVQIAGFVYLAVLCGYMIFLSPHRGRTRQQRRSLLEVPAIVAWILFWLWAVLPRGRVGLVLGGAMLAAALLYIIFLSGPLNKDRASDWGLGSPGELVRAMRNGRSGRRIVWAVLGANAVTLILSLAANRLAEEILRRVLRQSFSIKIEGDVSQAAVSVAAVLALNLLIFCIVRYDNIGRAARIVGTYLLCLLALITVAGYLFIVQVQGGSVELRAADGMKSVGTYIIWGIVQELLFLSYFNTRIRKGMDSPLLSSLLTAVVFSLFHLTCYALMFLCFLVGIVWALIFQAAPNVFCLGVAHGVSGGFGSAFNVKGIQLPKVPASVGPFNR